MHSRFSPFLSLIAQTLFDKKGFNILILDVRGVSTLTDYFILAEGHVDKHVVALAHALMEVMKQAGVRVVHTEGLQEGDWVVLDFSDIVVHLFKPQMREMYQLETLWQEGKVVNVPIKTESSLSGTYEESYG